MSVRFHTTTKPWVVGMYLLLAFLLCIQLYGLTQHHHDLSTSSDHCAACDLEHQFSGGTPPAVLPAILLIDTFFVRLIFQLTWQTNEHVSTAYLHPLSQGPPVVVE